MNNRDIGCLVCAEVIGELVLVESEGDVDGSAFRLIFSPAGDLSVIVLIRCVEIDVVVQRIIGLSGFVDDELRIVGYLAGFFQGCNDCYFRIAVAIDSLGCFRLGFFFLLGFGFALGFCFALTF